MSTLAVLAFRGWIPWPVALLICVAATVAVVFVYLREAGRVPVWRRAVLASLRALALGSILFLALRPTLLTETHGKRPRPVAVLVDDSQSMLAHDPRPNFPDKWRVAVGFDKVAPDKAPPAMPSAGDLPGDLPEKPTRLELAQATLANPRLKLLEKLAAVGPLQPASFGIGRSAKDPRDPNWFKALTGQEPRTALADGVFDILKRDENELPGAIVLVTDGKENASQRGLDDLARECARLNVPLHIYGVGSSSFGQVQIREAGVPETLFVDDTVNVAVKYRVRGFKDGKVEIVVKLNGQEAARKIVDVKEGDDLREVLSFVPQQKDAQAGKQELSTTVRVLSGPDDVTDELTKSVRVVDRKMKVLLIDSIPRWDFKFLQRALLRDRRVEPKFILTEGDRRAMDAGAPFLPKFPATRQELLAYDLLILGDIPASYLSLEQQGFVREFVAEGGGLIHIAGRNNGPASFVGTPLAEVLPVEFTSVKFPIDSGTRAQPFRPDLTPAGIRSPLLSMEDDPVESLRVWRTLPEIFWAYPVTKTKPAAEVLLTHPTQRTTDNKPMPLLASHYYGKGYVMFCGFDETWRWRFNVADKYFGRFWSQAVYITGVPRTLGTKLTQLSLDNPDPQLGKTGQVYGRLFTPDLKPLNTERLEARLEKLDVGPDDKDRSAPIELRALPGQPGDFVATLPFNRVGRFALRVDNGSDPATLEYRVSLPPDHELAPGGMAEDDLRRLAEASGGKFYREEDLHTMPGSIKQKLVPFTQRDEILLWNRWALFWVIGLLSAEWFLRKFNSLS
ncbi:glutamine amidotransferase [Fimbriiglobus ruber]|uniref:Putative glutamine amidotransferase domain-containing protein n=1 Tax=Fimbriiglobus ruber TaxID=1908690 RepID=A0A225EEI5_9BACT|nr:glutamine amidotransferase [Fimbriiglobus ruber]OWK46707.1 hypothetical protein FRUB_00406 [Fimbriiglobus ruber]